MPEASRANVRLSTETIGLQEAGPIVVKSIVSSPLPLLVAVTTNVDTLPGLAMSEDLSTAKLTP